MQNFHELVVWQKSHRLVLRIYTVSKDLPQSENFGLILNLRRCALSMASRIAEGSGKPTNEDFDADLKRARAVGYELEYLLLVSRDLGFIDGQVYEQLAADVIEIRKMLSGLLKRVRTAP